MRAKRFVLLLWSDVVLFPGTVPVIGPVSGHPAGDRQTNVKDWRVHGSQ